MTIRRRLVLLSAGAVALAIALASVVVYGVVRGNLRGQVDDALRTDQPKVFFVSSTQRVPPDELKLQQLSKTGPDTGLRAALPPGKFGDATGVAQVVTSDGKVVAPAGAPAELPIKSAAAAAKVPGGVALADRSIKGVHVRVLSAKLSSGAVLQIARPLTDVDRTLRNLLWVLGAVTLGGIALAAGLGLLVARGTLKPVRRLTATAEHVAATQDLSHRLPAGRRDELDRLGASFNTMLAALEGSREAQRQLVADASHELRTPLTSVRTNVELLARAPDLPEQDRERIVTSVSSQVEELSVLVGDLVDLARPAAGAAGIEAAEELRLDLVVAEVVEVARHYAPGRDFVVDASPCVVHGSRPRLHRAIHNLVDNAVKWSPAGRPIEIRVAEGEVVVRDHGPGIADEDLPHVFDRFYRASSARGLPGSGLGLAIVRQVAETHGGSVRAESAAGGGAQLRLHLSPIS
jgi:two-component system sensor histidine kinase MprB